ncbi:MAG: hypothetical protein IPP67_07540 [Rhodospirillaceae bacterium]|nr:hypothetical protein [Rhodospirillaceae bacterium]
MLPIYQFTCCLLAIAYHAVRRIRRITGMSVWHHNIGRLIAPLSVIKTNQLNPNIGKKGLLN